MVANVDDINFVGLSDSVLFAFDKLGTGAPRIGLTLRFEKCKFLWPHCTPIPSTLFSQLASRFLTPVFGSMPTLGSIIGFDKDSILNGNNLVKSHDKFFDIILHPCVIISMCFTSSSSLCSSMVTVYDTSYSSINFISISFQF